MVTSADAGSSALNPGFQPKVEGAQSSPSPTPRRRQRGRRGRADAQRLAVCGVTAPQLHAEAPVSRLGRWQRPLLVPLHVGTAARPDDRRAVEDLVRVRVRVMVRVRARARVRVRVRVRARVRLELGIAFGLGLGLGL